VIPSRGEQLASLFLRGDVWQGHSRHFAVQKIRSSGYAGLDSILLHNGWPMATLTEILQRNQVHSEWSLVSPALSASSGYLVLVNPPAPPFVQALIQRGIDPDKVLIVNTGSAKDFVDAFVTLARDSACESVLAWQANLGLGYNDLRKCSLAAAEGQALTLLFRHSRTAQQASPASLRLLLDVQQDGLSIDILKQKGGYVAGGKRRIILPLSALMPAARCYQQLLVEPALYLPSSLQGSGSLTVKER